MTHKTGKKPPPKAMRWGEAEWAWLAEVAKSVGLSRSEFVRRSALLAANAHAAGLSSYFVRGAQATPQNTRINQSDRTIAKQGGGRIGGCGERTLSEPEAEAGQKSGGFLAGATNGTQRKAPKGRIAK